MSLATYIIYKRHGCFNEVRKGKIQEHLNICNYEEIVCPSHCGVKGMKGWIMEHLNISCPNYQLDCKYKERGCLACPQRGNYEEHIEFCGFKPMNIECGHIVHSKNAQSHAQECTLFPLRCTQCAHIMPRIEMITHKCVPFLLDKVHSLERQVLSISQENEINLKLQEKVKILESENNKLNSIIQEKEEINSSIDNLKKEVNAISYNNLADIQGKLEMLLAHNNIYY